MLRKGAHPPPGVRSHGRHNRLKKTGRTHVHRAGQVIHRDDATRQNIFKLANAEWVSPEHVEVVYTGHCAAVTQCFIHGSSSHTRVIALVVPETSAWDAHGAGGGTCEALEEEVLRQMSAATAASELRVRHFEVPLAVRALWPVQR